MPAQGRKTGGLPFPELCRALGRDAIQVRSLQRALGLHVPSGSEGYQQAYLFFLQRVVALSAFHVPADDIREIFETEKKILTLLHVDTLTDSPTWYLDGCPAPGSEEAESDRLLLTGHRVEGMDGDQIQHTFDFGQRDPELFKGAEMGEDLRRVIAKYVGLESALRLRIRREKPVVENALQWARSFLRSGRKSGAGADRAAPA
jgi:hypothetical protein